LVHQLRKILGTVNGTIQLGHGMGFCQPVSWANEDLDHLWGWCLGKKSRSWDVRKTNFVGKVKVAGQIKAPRGGPLRQSFGRQLALDGQHEKGHRNIQMRQIFGPASWVKVQGQGLSRPWAPSLFDA
jgi:hypothetical protein